MNVSTNGSARALASAAIRAGIAALVLDAGAALAAIEHSPLVVPAVELIDVAPLDRSIGVSIVRGSVTSTDEHAVGIRAVHLPEGAQVTALAAFAIDENGAENLQVQLWRRQISTGHLEGIEMAAAPTIGTSAAMQEPRDTSVSAPEIENGLYVYWVAARMPADTELFGIQIEYLVPLFADGFESEDTSAWLGAVEPGFTSPVSVNFADLVSTTVGLDGCWYGGDTGSTAEAYVMGGEHDGAGCCFVAPVHLPNGVEVTFMISYLVDSGASDITLSLRRKSLANQVVSVPLATLMSSGSGNSVRLFADGTIQNSVIDNDSYSYFLSSDTCLDPERELVYYQTLIFFDE